MFSLKRSSKFRPRQGLTYEIQALVDDFQNTNSTLNLMEVSVLLLRMSELLHFHIQDKYSFSPKRLL